jgi:nucleoside-diphosphate-sugar epimerase
MKFTVLGSSGFIGGRLVHHLRDRGHEVDCPPRNTDLLRGRHLNHLVFAIGLTGDFRKRPFDAIEAHVNVACRVLQETSFDSFLYLSSTRVYGGLPPDAIASESASLSVAPNADSLYDLSKLLGEAACLTMKSPAVRVARLSNVYGPGHSPHTFLGAVTKELRDTGRVTIHDDPASSKDYVSIEDVLPTLEAIALTGRDRIYNVASGQPVRCRDLATWIQRPVTFSGRGTPRIFPRIDVSKISEEFSFLPRSLEREFPKLLQAEGAA